MQAPAPFFVDETATFHIAVYRLLIRFFQIVAPKTRLCTQLNTHSTFTFFLKFPISRDSIARRFLIPQHFMSMLIQTKFCLSGTGQLNFPALSPSQPHLCIFGLDRPVLLYGVFIRLDTTGGIVVSVAVYISYLSLEHRVFF